MMKHVEGHSNLIKDDQGLVHNINRTEIEQSRERKRARVQKQFEIDEMKKDVENIKGELNDIKTSLHKILEIVQHEKLESH